VPQAVCRCGRRLFVFHADVCGNIVLGFIVVPPMLEHVAG